MRKSILNKLIVLLILAICVSLVVLPVTAAGMHDVDVTDAVVILDGTTDLTVEVSFVASSDIGVYVVQGNWSTTENEDTEHLTLSAITSNVLSFTGNNDASISDGYLIWSEDTYTNPAQFTKDQSLFTATYTVPANTPEGDYTVSFFVDYLEYEDGDCIDVTYYTATIKVEHKAACDHLNKTYTYETNSNDTHKVKCECGEVVTENENCSGGTATCTEKAICTKCGQPYGEAKGHSTTNFRYEHITGTNTHSVVCGDCDTATKTVNCSDKDGDGNHKCDYCSNTAAVTECKGGTATCTAKAVCTECHTAYGELGAHTYGNLIDAKPEVHTEDELKGAVAAHYLCACGKYFTESKALTTLEALTSAAPVHTKQADDGDCTTDILCSCGKVMVEGNEKHTGGTATCTEKATCSECGQKYGELGAHTYGNLIDAKPEVHTEDELKGAVAAHYLCACGKYFTESKAETTLAALTSAAPVHTKQADDGDCTTDILCSCGKVMVEGNEKHTGGEATCKEKAKCTVCGTSYGELAPNNHKNTYVAADFHSTGNNTHYQWIACNDCDNKKIEKTEEVGCSGGTATCVAKAICEKCNTAYGELGAHTYGNLIDAKPEVHTEDELKGAVAAHYLCACGKYFTESKALTTLEALTSAAPVHTKQADDGDCTTDILCSCGKVMVEGNEKHTGGTATCTEKATCSECGQKYGELGAHTYGNLIDAKPEVHTKDELKGAVAAHYLCACGKYFTESKAETTLAALTSAAPVHTKQADDGDCTTDILCSCGKVMVEGNEKHTGGTATCTEKATCSECGQKYGELGDHTYGETVAAQAATCLAGGNVAYKQCAVCELYFAADAAADSNEGKATNEDFLTKKDSTNHVGKETTSCTNDGATHTVTVTCECDGVVSETKGISHSYNHQTRDFECECGAKYTGWSQSTDGEGTTWTCYVKNGEVLRGWNEVEGSWYYFSTTSGQPATGMTRVPYPTKEINGVTYRPNAEDKAYWEAHKNDAKDPSEYSDAETAVFYFDADGKFVQFNGVGGKSFFINGMAPWHVGFVKIDGEYYYFAGDKVNGGNVMATGKVYATRDYNADKSVGSGMIYMFDDNGKLIENKGIVDGYYYNDDNTLAIGKGLTAYGDGYIYVRSNGQIVTNAKYWITAPKLIAAGITDYKAGMYSFDANGMLVLPEIEPELNGIVEKDGKYYYYKDGVKQAGAGVVKMSDAEGETFYIYVTSDGSLATGEYWPTNRNDLLERGAYDWGTDGKYYPKAN